MRLSIRTHVMGDLSFTDMLDKCVAPGIERTGSNWSKSPPFRADRLLADKGALKAALNCSAGPLDSGPVGQRHREKMEQTIRLADVNGLLGPKKVTDVANRSWSQVAVGASHDLQWWKELFSVVRKVGCNG